MKNVVFSINKKEKNQDLDRSLLKIMGRIIRKQKKAVIEYYRNME